MLLIGGFQKFSLIDYPGKVAAVVFTQGCDFRCPFCHNPDLVLPEKFSKAIDEKEILDFLKKRQGQLLGVVVTGGEPTIQKDLPSFLRKIKELGFLVKLDTNGHHPQVLNVLDIQESINLLLDSKIEYHFRTTVIKCFLKDEDLSQMSKMIERSSKYILQEFSSKGDLLDKSLMDIGHYTSDEFSELQKKWQKC